MYEASDSATLQLEIARPLAVLTLSRHCSPWRAASVVHEA